MFSNRDKWAHGRCELDNRVVQRGDLVMVMGKDEEGLLKGCTVMTFALQTKPWAKEVDLRKSFVNVDLEFLRGGGWMSCGWISRVAECMLTTLDSG